MIGAGSVTLYFFTQLFELYNLEMKYECRGRSLVPFSLLRWVFAGVWLMRPEWVPVVREAGLVWVWPYMDALGGAVPNRVFGKNAFRNTTCGCLGGRRERELVWPVNIFLMLLKTGSLFSSFFWKDEFCSLIQVLVWKDSLETSSKEALCHQRLPCTKNIREKNP